MITNFDFTTLSLVNVITLCLSQTDHFTAASTVRENLKKVDFNIKSLFQSMEGKFDPYF